MSGTNDDELKRDLRAAYGANLPGEEFDRRVLDRIDLDDGETEFSVPAPARTRLWPWAVAAAAILLILAGTPFAWRAVESKLPGAVLTPVSPVPMPVLPQAAPPAPRQPAALLILDVKADGSFRINGVACTREELEPVLRGEALRLRAQAAEDGVAESPVQVLVRAEEGVVWQRVQTIMQACADPSIRFYKFQFATPEDLADAPFERGTGALTIVVKGGGEIRVGSRTVPLARLAELLKLESSSSPRHVRDDGKWVSDLQVVIRRV